MIGEWISAFGLRVRALLHRRRLDRDLEDELQFHHEMREGKLREGGAAPAVARHEARRRFGNATAIRERCRELWTFGGLETLLQDLRYAVRVFAQSPGFTAVAVLSLALGIGANTSVFSLINGLMLERLPVRAPEQLVALHWTAAKSDNVRTSDSRSATDEATGVQYCDTFSYSAFEHFRQNSRLLSDVFAFASLRDVNANVGGQARIATGLVVSGNYYQSLGVRPLAGRLLDERDDAAGAEAVAVVSYQLWRDAFGENASAIGSAVTVNGIPLTVVGVTPPEFYGASAVGQLHPPDITAAMSMHPKLASRWMRDGESWFLAPDHWWVKIMGRVAGSTTFQSLNSELETLFRQSVGEAENSSPVQMEQPGIFLLPGAHGLDSLRWRFSRPLWALLAVAGLVLLIVCANLANLLLARAAARRKEITVRLAVGAGRGRIVRQLLTETLLLSGIGGATGLLLSYWGSRALLVMMADSAEAARISLAPDMRVLGFAVAISVLTGVVFGLAPAFRASRVRLVSALKEGAGTLRTPRRGGHNSVLGRGLIVVQVAMTLLLLIGAGLFLRTLGNLQNIEIGFRSEGLLLFHIDPTLNGYDSARVTALYRELLERAGELPGVISVTASGNRLLSGVMFGGPMYVPGSATLEKGRMQVHVNNVSPNFFETMGIPIVAGRGVRITDIQDAPLIAVINQTAARQAFPEGSPVGRRIGLWTDEDGANIQVVGIARDAKYDGVKNEIPPTAYIPYEQNRWGVSGMHFAIRAAGRPEALAGPTRALLREIDPDVPMTDVMTQQHQIEDLLRTEHLFARLSTVFGALALALASIGIYGTLIYACTRRTGEIGIRMALGAQFSDIAWLVLRQVLVEVVVGVVIGLAGTFGAARLVESMLYGLEPQDPATLAAAVLIIAFVAVLAAYIPARRAARVSPTVALRYE